MKEYIWKFLSVIFSLNLFLSGIANSMMPTPNKKVIDYFMCLKRIWRAEKNKLKK